LDSSCRINSKTAINNGPNSERNSTTMNNLDKNYQNLLQDILQNGVKKDDRTGTGVLSVFGRQFRHKMEEGFPLLTTKKMAWKTMVVELLWFLRGDTNIKFLLDYDCHIWDGDAYKNYSKNVQSWQPHLDNKMFIDRIKNNLDFAKKWGELGPIYGKQWRDWNGFEIIGGEQIKGYNKGQDQIQNLINELKTNPDSRRLMVSAWNVGELDQMVLPPCHYGFQVYTRELKVWERLNLASKTYDTFDPFDFGTPDDVDHSEIDKLYPVPKRAISLMWNQRSVDTFLGLPFNIASYGLLLEIISREVNMVPDELIGNLGDVHLYSNHIEQAKEQISRTPFKLPSVKITERNWFQHELVKEHLGEKTFIEKIMSYRPDCFELVGYESHGKIKAPLSN
jgi:thymidylate synthase